MLGIRASESGEDPAVATALAEIGEQLEGRRVLLVFRDGNRELDAQIEHPAVRAVCARLAPVAAAVLLFRMKQGAVAAHFEVVHSTLDELAVGARMRDPRTG